MASFLALSSAALLGVGDFFGGLVTRRSGPVAMVIVLQVVGVPIMLGLALAGGARPAVVDLAWGSAAGLAGGLGIGLLYLGLASGAMSAVAPVTAVCAASVPVLVGVHLGERVSAAAWMGIVLALVAIALMSRDPTRRRDARARLASLGAENRTAGAGLASLGAEDRAVASDDAGAAAPTDRSADAAAVANGAGREAAGGRRVIAVGVVAGVMIGAFYVLISRTSPASGLWPLVASRSTAFVFYLAGGLASGRSLWPPPTVLRPALAGALLDAFGTALYLLAVQRGPLMLIAVLTSLYPASTVLLATLVLAERLSGARILGLITATAAVVLIVSG